MKILNLQFLGVLAFTVMATSCMCDRTETVEISGQLVESCSDRTPISNAILEYSTGYDGTVYDTSDAQGNFKVKITTEKTISLWVSKLSSLHAYRTEMGQVVDTVRLAEHITESTRLHVLPWQQDVTTSFNFATTSTPYTSSDSLYVFVMGSDYRDFSRIRLRGPIDSTTVLDSIPLVFPPHTGYYNWNAGIEIWIGESSYPFDDLLYRASLNTVHGNLECLDYVQPLLFEDF